MNKQSITEYSRSGAGKDRTPIMALHSDPRFSFSLYVPPDLGPKTQILVTVHGNMRNLIATRDEFADFGLWKNVVVLAPLFPIGVLGNYDKDGFKFIKEGGIRYDLVLLDMIAQARAYCGIPAETFSLFGFAGGAQFAHRFALLHPSQLWAVSVAAPGSVTLFDISKDWWLGIGNVQQHFGTEIDVDALRQLPIQLVVGGADTDEGTNTNSLVWMPGGREAGETALERLRSLEASLKANGIIAELAVVPRKGHHLADLAPVAKLFLARHLPQHA
jgi:poly(3-hydroxybutyrate) depolymerase